MKTFLLGRYNPDEDLSGPEKAAKRLFHHLSAMDTSISFCTYFFSGADAGRWNKLFGMKHITGRNMAKVCCTGLFPLLHMLYTERPAVVHLVNYEHFFAFILLAKPFLKFKVVYTAHGLAAYEAPMRKHERSLLYRFKDYLAERIIYQLADAVCFVSSQQQQLAQSVLLPFHASTSIIPNGVDQIVPVQKQKSASNNLLFVGNPNRAEKGFPFLLEIISRLKTSVTLHIISNETYSQPVLIPDNVSVRYHNRMQSGAFIAFLGDIDIILLTSNYETFSIATAEAMTAGVVPIVTAQSGISSYIKASENGYVVDYGDAESAAGYVESLLQNPALYTRLSGNAQKLPQLLSWNQTAKRYLELYQNKKALRDE